MNPRNFMAPGAAFTMACVLLVYTRSSIRSARDQAKSSKLPGNGEHAPRRGSS